MTRPTESEILADTQKLIVKMFGVEHDLAERLAARYWAAIVSKGGTISTLQENDPNVRYIVGIWLYSETPRSPELRYLEPTEEQIIARAKRLIVTIFEIDEGWAHRLAQAYRAEILSKSSDVSDLIYMDSGIKNTVSRWLNKNYLKEEK